MTSSLSELTSPDVAARLDKTPIAVLPVGSIEQHGPHLPCGTDTMAAKTIARAVADATGALYAPFCDYGFTPIHRGYPGTVSLRRRTFEALLTDVSSELVRMGVKTLVYVNWHELNTPLLDAVAAALQEELPCRVYVVQACYVTERVYAPDGGELSHGGGIEVMAVMASSPGTLRLDSAPKPSRPPGAAKADEMRRSREIYGFISDVAEIASDGWYGDPQWATEQRASTFPERVVEAIVDRLETIGALGSPS